VNCTKTPKANGDGDEQPKMVTLKPIPTAVLKIRKKQRKTEKRTEIAQVIPEAIPISPFLITIKAALQLRWAAFFIGKLFSTIHLPEKGHLITAVGIILLNK
jgi:hypothetical protein